MSQHNSKGHEGGNGEIKAVITNRGVIYPRLVVNAAGVFSDIIAEMAGIGHLQYTRERERTLFLTKNAQAMPQPP